MLHLTLSITSLSIPFTECENSKISKNLGLWKCLLSLSFSLYQVTGKHFLFQTKCVTQLLGEEHTCDG